MLSTSSAPPPPPFCVTYNEVTYNEAVNLLRCQIHENVSCTIALLCLRRSFESLDQSSLVANVEKQTTSLISRLSRAASEKGHFAIAGIGRRVLFTLREASKKKNVVVSTTATAASISTSHNCEVSNESLDNGLHEIVEKVSVSDLALLFGIDDEQISKKYDAEIPSSLKWSKGLSQAVLDIIGEIEDEVENQVSSLSTLTSDLLKPVGEIILLHTPSGTIISWLLDAHRKRGRNFQVIICEGDSDGLQGHESASSISAPIPVKKNALTEKQPQKSGKNAPVAILDKLSATGIHTTLIPDSAAWACMPRVTLVVLSSVLISKSTTTSGANVLCSAGSSMIAVAAKAHSVPVMVFTSSLSILPIQQETIHAIANSQSSDPKTALQMSVVDANSLGLGSSQGGLSVLPSIVCPKWDALGNDLVDLVVCSSGVFSI